MPAIDFETAINRARAVVNAPVATATVEPDATVSPGALALAAADKEAQTQATAIAQSAAGRTQAAATTRRAYAAVEHGLQRYADALGRFRDSNRQVAERPAVMTRSSSVAPYGIRRRSARPATCCSSSASPAWCWRAPTCRQPPSRNWPHRVSRLRSSTAARGLDW